MVDLVKSADRKPSLGWIFWWIIDPAELKKQVDHYKTLKITQSARGISLLLFGASAIITALMVEFLNHNRWAYVDSVVFLILGGFIYFGYRWAMILGMVLWTLEKLLQLAPMVRHGVGPSLPGIFIFWAVFMHAMFLAFRVEQARRKGPSVTAAAFD